jgi:hypothetical protein
MYMQNALSFCTKCEEPTPTRHTYRTCKFHPSKNLDYFFVARDGRSPHQPQGYHTNTGDKVRWIYLFPLFVLFLSLVHPVLFLVWRAGELRYAVAAGSRCFTNSVLYLRRWVGIGNSFDGCQFRSIPLCFLGSNLLFWFLSLSCRWATPEYIASFAIGSMHRANTDHQQLAQELLLDKPFDGFDVH